MARKKKLLSIVIPVYNEENNLTELFRQLDQTFKAEPFNYELITVDDGSRDRSMQVLRASPKSSA